MLFQAKLPVTGLNWGLDCVWSRYGLLYSFPTPYPAFNQHISLSHEVHLRTPLPQPAETLNFSQTQRASASKPGPCQNTLLNLTNPDHKPGPCRNTLLNLTNPEYM